MTSILVVGLGRVGLRTLGYLKELIPEATYLAVDTDKSKLDLLRGVEGVEPYQYEPGILGRLGERVDLAVTALPSSTAFRSILELVGRCVDVVDVSFFPEDPYTLNKVVEDCHSALIVDAGFAPGYSNVVVGYAYFKLGLGEDIEIDVGGLPEKPLPPIGYVVTWNPRDLLEEYTRPARYVENGVFRSVRPLEAIRNVEVKGVGVFEGFLSDGLRTMLRNIKARNLREITIRWPNHLSAMKLLYELGFLDDSEVNVGGVSVKPIDLTAAVLEKKLSASANDIAILQVVAKGAGKFYHEVAVLKGSPRNPATPTFTALVHAYTAKITLGEKLKPGVVTLEELYEYKQEYEEHLSRHGVIIKKGASVFN